MGFSPATYAQIVFTFIIMLDGVNTTDISKEVNYHLSFLMCSSILILHTVWRATFKGLFYVVTKHNVPATHKDLFSVLTKYVDWLRLFVYTTHILLPTIFRDSSSLSLYLPPILDIFDGIQMTEKQLDPLMNPVWVQTLICLAVFMCYIPSLYEIYHLRFPQPTNGSIKVSKRTVNLIQFASSVVFLVLRVVLLACDGSDLTDVFKSMVRFYGHYQMWLKLRRRRKIISVQAREISAEKACCFAKEKKAFFQRLIALRDAITLKAVFHFNRIVAKRSVFYCVYIISSA